MKRILILISLTFTIFTNILSEDIKVKFKIYTLKENTPEGNLKLRFHNNDSKTYDDYMLPEQNSNISDSKLFERELIIKDFRNATNNDNFKYYIEIYNSNNSKALGLFNEVLPMTRILYTKDFFFIENNEFIYKEIIRKWEDTTDLINLRIKGSITIDGIESSTTPILLTMYHNNNNSDTNSHYKVYSTIIVPQIKPGIFELQLPRSIANEDLLGFNDYFYIKAQHNLFSSTGISFNYSDIANEKIFNFGEIELTKHKMIKFKWSYYEKEVKTDDLNTRLNDLKPIKTSISHIHSNTFGISDNEVLKKIIKRYNISESRGNNLSNFMFNDTFDYKYIYTFYNGSKLGFGVIPKFKIEKINQENVIINDLEFKESQQIITDIGSKYMLNFNDSYVLLEILELEEITNDIIE